MTNRQIKTKKHKKLKNDKNYLRKPQKVLFHDFFLSFIALKMKFALKFLIKLIVQMLQHYFDNRI